MPTGYWVLSSVTEVYDLLVLRSTPPSALHSLHRFLGFATFLPCGFNADNWECMEWLLRGIPRLRLPSRASAERGRSRRRFCSPVCCARGRRSAICFFRRGARPKESVTATSRG